MITAQDVLSAAADVIDQRGWRQNTPTTFDLPLCAGEAIDFAAAKLAVDREIRNQAMDLLVERIQMPLTFGAPVGAIVHWNDQYGRTQEQVVATLRGATT